jgi:hypothetical protein
LNKVSSQEVPEERLRQYVVSSNVLYYEALWNAAKRSSGIVAFRKYYSWKPWIGRPVQSQTTKKSSALVDIVAENGTEWIRVSTISEKRLLFDLAKLGWQNDSDSDDDTPNTQSSNWEGDEDDDQVEIVKNVRDLVRAARANTVQGRPPKVTVILTRMIAGKTKAVDRVLDDMRATGATIYCANEVPETPALSDALAKMLINRSRAISETINIDCTILLALISDISHKPCPILDWYNGEVSQLARFSWELHPRVR